MIRPVFCYSVVRPSRTPELSVFLVHLVSGWPDGAQAEMNALISVIGTLIPQNTAAVIVGDMNINLLTTALTLPANWYLLRTGVATQQSGGELDYALLFDPTRIYQPTATVAILQQFKTGNNQSDHSVLQYTIPLY
jgi:hypothetical protein